MSVLSRAFPRCHKNDNAAFAHRANSPEIVPFGHMACFGVWSSMESVGLTDCSVVRLPTSWPSGSSTLAFCSTHRMQTHKHILGRQAGYSAQRHHSTSFCRLTSLQKARSPCGAAYPVGRQGSRQPQKAPIGKILQQSTYAFASFPRTAKQKKLFRAGGVRDRHLAGTEKQAVCCLIYSFVMHIKFDNRSSALPYNWMD